MPNKKGSVQNLILVFIVLLITIPTILYLLNKSDFHTLNSFSPPVGYDTGVSPQNTPSPTTR